MKWDMKTVVWLDFFQIQINVEILQKLKSLYYKAKMIN